MMSRFDSRNGSSHFVPNKSKSVIQGVPLYYGRNAPHFNEEEHRQLLASRREILEEGKQRPNQKGFLKVREKDMVCSSKKLAVVTDVEEPKIKSLSSSYRKYPAERKENQLSSSSSKTNGNLSTSGQNCSLLKFGFNDESYRVKVVRAISMFRDICDQRSKDNQKHNGEIKAKRVDLIAAKDLKERNMHVHAGVKFVGLVPGVEVGDIFMYRMELAVVGLHYPLQNGIDYTSENGEPLATSVIASKVYSDELKNPDEVIYVGEGGMPSRKKQPEDQKLVRGNRALVNNFRTKTPVRVIRQEGQVKTRTIHYMYDGLYMVESYEKVRAATGQLVYKFTLKKSPDQEYFLPCKIKF